MHAIAQDSSKQNASPSYALCVRAKWPWRLPQSLVPLIGAGRLTVRITLFHGLLFLIILFCYFLTLLDPHTFHARPYSLTSFAYFDQWQKGIQGAIFNSHYFLPLIFIPLLSNDFLGFHMHSYSVQCYNLFI